MIRLELPWPPSINHYWRRNPRGGNFISAEGKAYLKGVAEWVLEKRVPKLDGIVSFKVRLYPPNRLRRDLDNSLKVLIDAIAKAGVLGDDFQIKHIEATMLDVVRDGHATVVIEELVIAEAIIEQALSDY